MSGLFDAAGSFSTGGGVRVVPDGVRAFGSTSLRAAEEVARAGGIDLQANVSSLSPAMGLIGADFVAAFAVTQGAHTRAVAQLAYVYASGGVAAHDAAARYETLDAATAAGLGAAVAGLGDAR
ncbi:type VII secretion target [Rhodococcus sp. GXMU-t2271]|uniref:Type VII secretion target n=1 Tax=Rhodococcus indonesiensis TaxID=3055869 RepID=A0ABT7RPB0_9NOCA|nr:type VII secretion target [Rhodococcus indonesiensis]MDM7489488.1 type VII secretion target [Rhodococcus indonesiensis]